MYSSQPQWSRPASGLILYRINTIYYYLSTISSPLLTTTGSKLITEEGFPLSLPGQPEHVSGLDLRLDCNSGEVETVALEIVHILSIFPLVSSGN